MTTAIIASVGKRNDHILLTPDTCRQITDQLNAKGATIGGRGATMVPGSAKFDGERVTIEIQLQPEPDRKFGSSLGTFLSKDAPPISLDDYLFKSPLLRNLK